MAVDVTATEAEVSVTVTSFVSRKGLLELGLMLGGDIRCGLEGLEPIRLRKGLLERKGEGFLSAIRPLSANIWIFSARGRGLRLLAEHSVTK